GHPSVRRSRRAPSPSAGDGPSSLGLPGLHRPGAGLHSWSMSAPAPATLLSVRVNGQPVQVAVQPHHTLLEVLRYQLDLIGSKQGCDKGDCGACTVQIDGIPQLSCLTLALHAEGREVTTVEGLGQLDG